MVQLYDGLKVLRLNNNFYFECHRKLGCFTRCCRNINILLMPYDIIQLKNNLHISSDTFLQKHTYTMMGKNGLPAVGLKMNDDEKKSCPFVSDAGCSVYESRPWACRVYPLQPEFTRTTEKNGDQYYSVMDVPFCMGLKSNKVSIVKKWLDEQDVPVYQKMESIFKEITSASFLSDKIIENQKIQQMFFMACYDIDRFRKFIFQSSFLEKFDIGKQEISEIRTDDTALYRFAMKWVAFGLLNQQTLKVKPEVVKAKKETLGLN